MAPFPRRFLPLLLALALPACDGPTLVGLGAATVVSLPLTGRAPPDLIVSAVTGRDCSIVRLDRGMSYCAAAAPAPGNAPYCTRSLGQTDCWVTRPPLLGPPLANGPRGVVDGPTGLTPAQEADRTARWPGLF
ncbi:hypothetical protein [Roseococcus microcysteis]|uniref:hypothetical protein n=1 Tax=Roseococcus microcysteis TaxID=2771361 RepID=UPI00168A9167|nr:hypothetical protein [Roseococcus microcysteis]